MPPFGRWDNCLCHGNRVEDCQISAERKEALLLLVTARLCVGNEANKNLDR